MQRRSKVDDAETYLSRVRTMLLDRGWCKGTMRDTLGRVCLFGAIIAVEEQSILPPVPEGHDTLNLVVLKRLRRLAGTDSLTVWNDLDTRKFDDVLTLLERAIGEKR